MKAVAVFSECFVASSVRTKFLFELELADTPLIPGCNAHARSIPRVRESIFNPSDPGRINFLGLLVIDTIKILSVIEF